MCQSVSTPGPIRVSFPPAPANRIPPGTRGPFAETVARFCRLLPAEGDDLTKVVALADRAVAAKSSTAARIYPAQRRSWARVRARSWRWQNTGTAKPRRPATGSHKRSAFDWSQASADTRDHWIWHFLRREADGSIADDNSADSWPKQHAAFILSVTGGHFVPDCSHARLRLHEE